MESLAVRNGYQLTEEELKKIQMTQIELICEVDRICKKCGIRYNMVGGTMLGAIRHKGYIPWDDDADIGFLREEYEKFRQACKRELDKSRFYFQDCRDVKGYRWGYGKLRRKGTKFIRLGQEFMPYAQGIAIDLMPFDNVPDTNLGRKIHMLVCFVYRKIFWSAVGRKNEKNLGKRLLFELLYKIPEKRLFRSYQKFIDWCGRKPTKQVRILTFPTPKGIYGYDRRWYTELKDYDFEGYRFPGPIDYDGYLRVKYKNYMEWPPIEKRKIHPISKLMLLKQEELSDERNEEI